MPVPLQPSSAGHSAVSRPLVAGLFVSSVLLSVVSWYTTQQGMALYLSPWFSFLASLGVQSALVLVAWLVGVTESRRGLLVAVYAVTAAVSIAFSYVSLHTWFASRERPATIERALYDELNAAAGKSQELAHRGGRRGAEARAGARRDDGGREGPRLHLAGHGPGPVPRPGPRGGGPRGRELRRLLPRGPGPGAALHGLRPAREPRPADGRPPPGVAEGPRRLPGRPEAARPDRAAAAGLPPGLRRDPLDRRPRDAARRGRAARRARLLRLRRPRGHGPGGPGDRLHGASSPRRRAGTSSPSPWPPSSTSSSSCSPTPRAPSSSARPRSAGCEAGAALDSADEQVFARDLLRKVGPSPQGLARVEAAALSPGERQLVLLLASRGLAAPVEEDGRRFYLLDASVHRTLAESLADRRLPLRASAAQPAGG